MVPYTGFDGYVTVLEHMRCVFDQAETFPEQLGGRRVNRIKQDCVNASYVEHAVSISGE